MATSKEMTAGPALPLILKFTLPLLLGNLLQQTYSLVDAAIVGKFLLERAHRWCFLFSGSAMDVAEVSEYPLRRSLGRGITVRCAVMWPLV